MTPIEILSPDHVFIISAELSSEGPLENMRATIELETELLNAKVPYKPLYGSYQGKEEASFLVVGLEHYDFIQSLMKRFKQECIMSITPQRRAYLYYGDDKTEYLGEFGVISEEKALENGNYSYCYELRSYYGIL